MKWSGSSDTEPSSGLRACRCKIAAPALAASIACRAMSSDRYGKALDIVGVWIALNAVCIFHFDVYPFILLNLAFSLQAAYAAPLILLAQTRQADRDKAHADADAQHREALARASDQRQSLAAAQTATLLELMQQNTDLTEVTRALSERIESLTEEVHRRMTAKD